MTQENFWFTGIRVIVNERATGVVEILSRLKTDGKRYSASALFASGFCFCVYKKTLLYYLKEKV